MDILMKKNNQQHSSGVLLSASVGTQESVFNLVTFSVFSHQRVYMMWHRPPSGIVTLCMSKTNIIIYCLSNIRSYQDSKCLLKYELMYEFYNSKTVI